MTINADHLATLLDVTAEGEWADRGSTDRAEWIAAQLLAGPTELRLDYQVTIRVDAAAYAAAHGLRTTEDARAALREEFHPNGLADMFNGPCADLLDMPGGAADVVELPASVAEPVAVRLGDKPVQREGLGALAGMMAAGYALYATGCEAQGVPPLRWSELGEDVRGRLMVQARAVLDAYAATVRE